MVMLLKTVGNNAFAQYGGTSLGWSGGLTRNGFNNHQSYMIYISNTDTINYKEWQLTQTPCQFLLYKGE